MKAKYYEALAKAIKGNSDKAGRLGMTVIWQQSFLKDLCTILKAENPGFDENKFRELVK